MAKKLELFRVQIASHGLSETQAANLIVDLREQLDIVGVMGTYKLCWESDSQAIKLDLEKEGFTADSAAAQAAEEILELASALVTGTVEKEVRVEILWVIPAVGNHS